MLKCKTLHHHQFLESYTELSERIRTRRNPDGFRKVFVKIKFVGDGEYNAVI